MEAARRMEEMRPFREKVQSDQFIPMPVFGKRLLLADVMQILKPLRPLMDAGPRSRGAA